jgi:hypothetical protein
MIDIEQRLRRTFSSMAGNESLADGIDEAAAADMLKWGEVIAEHFVRKTSEMEDETADEFLSPYLRALRKMMRAIGSWVVEKDQAVRLDWWTRIEQNGKILYGEDFGLPAMESTQAQYAPDASAQQIITGLRTLFDGFELKG